MSEVTVTIDGRGLAVPEGSTIQEACVAAGTPQPTLCHLGTLTPANACRLCVVEVEGERVLAPSCSREVREGMRVATTSERVRHARKMVLEFLAASVELDQAPELLALITEYGADPARLGVERVAEGARLDNPLYVRAMDRCVLCYRCVQVCGEDAQWTFALTVSGRGSAATVSTEFDGDLPDSACVYCGNCVAVCPTGALQFRSEFALREAGMWNPEAQEVTATICPYCGVGCTVELHTQDNRIVKVTSPFDNDVTSGNLCVKGRFGYDFVHSGSEETPIDAVLRKR